MAQNPTFQKANLGLPNANTPFIVGQTPSQITQAWMMFFLQMNNAIAGNGAALEGAVQGIDDITDLRSQTLSSLTAQIIYVAGYYAEGDGGQGVFVQGAAGTDNGGTIIVDASGRTWRRQVDSSQVSVQMFGAKGNGTTDDTNSIQNALTWCGNVGGGIVWVPISRYFTTGRLSVPAGVSLRGVAVGPFNIDNPTTTDVCPLLLVTNTVGVFLSIVGDNAGITDLAFYYPNQVTWASATPTVYPVTVQISHGAGTRGSIGCHVYRCTSANAYQFLDIQTARYDIQDCIVGALNFGINVDHSLDYGFINNIMFIAQWNIFPAGAPAFPTPLDTYVMKNGYGLVIRRADSILASNLGFFIHYCGIFCTDTQVPGLSPPSGYGQISNVDIDTCQYGVLANSTDNTGAGFNFTNLNIGGVIAGTVPGVSAQAAIATTAGGGQPPLVTWNGGGVRGTWASGAVPTSTGAGRIYASNVRGLNPFGALGGLTPGMVASGGNQINPFPFTVRVFLLSVISGPITDVTINGTPIGTPAAIILYPGDSVGLVYTTTPTWVWLGL